MSAYQSTIPEKKSAAGSSTDKFRIGSSNGTSMLPAVPVLKNMATSGLLPGSTVQQNARRTETVQLLKLPSRATKDMSGNSETVQLATWANQPARFKTENGMPDVPQSEYDVNVSTYRRYAPINEQRAPGQVYQDGSRSFAYLSAKDNKSEVAAYTELAKPHPDNPDMIFLGQGESYVWGYRKPGNGLRVWDADVDAKGKVGQDIHRGHAVNDLGGPLPHLDNPEKVEGTKKDQQVMRLAQERGSFPSDAIMEKLVYGWIDQNFPLKKNEKAGVNDNEGFKALRADTDILRDLVSEYLAEEARKAERLEVARYQRIGLANAIQSSNRFPPAVSSLIASFVV